MKFRILFRALDRVNATIYLPQTVKAQIFALESMTEYQPGGDISYTTLKECSAIHWAPDKTDPFQVKRLCLVHYDLR